MAEGAPGARFFEPQRPRSRFRRGGAEDFYRRSSGKLLRVMTEHGYLTGEGGKL